jgi:hypothetical protein
MCITITAGVSPSLVHKTVDCSVAMLFVFVQAGFARLGQETVILAAQRVSTQGR